MARYRLAHRGLWAGMVVGALVAGGCERDREPQGGTAPPPEPQILDFPAELHAQDESVNAFIRNVIDICAAGDYEAFRMLWSARDDPFPRDQFHKAWKSVQKVTINAVDPLRNPKDDSILYAVQARVELEETVREPVRDVVILLAEERNQWRLTLPPEGLSDKLAEAKRATSQPHPSSQPAGVP